MAHRLCSCSRGRSYQIVFPETTEIAVGSTMRSVLRGLCPGSRRASAFVKLGENEAIDARLQRGAFAAREDAVGMNRTGPDAHPERVMSQERSRDKLRELGGKSELRGGAVCR